MNPPVPTQGLYTPVVHSFRFRRKKTSRNTFIMISVMCHTSTTLSVSWAVICTRAGTFVITICHNHYLSFLYRFFPPRFYDSALQNLKSMQIYYNKPNRSFSYHSIVRAFYGILRNIFAQGRAAALIVISKLPLFQKSSISSHCLRVKFA